MTGDSLDRLVWLYLDYSLGVSCDRLSLSHTSLTYQRDRFAIKCIQFISKLSNGDRLDISKQAIAKQEQQTQISRSSFLTIPICFSISLKYYP